MTPAPRGNLGTIHAEAAALHPDRTAVIDAERDERISYEELDDRTAAASAALRELGVERGDRVALFFTNEPAYVYAFFGALRIGAVPVPANVKEGRETLRFVVEDSGASTVVAGRDREIRETAAAIAGDLETVDTLVVGGDDPGSVSGVRTAASFPALLDESTADASAVPVAPDDPALQPYTSGSTGKPKGVVLTHGGALWNAETISQVHLFDEDERGLVAAPVYHKNAMSGAVKPLFDTGGSLVLLDGFDPERTLGAIEEYDVTYMTGVPAMYRLMLDAEAELEARDLSSLEWVIASSDTVPEQLYDDIDAALDVDVLETYGLTEGGPVVTASPRWGPRKRGSAGLALPDVETEVVDPEDGRSLPTGETGELLVSNPGLGRYHERPEAAEEAFETRDGTTYLHTSDLATKDDQGYHYLVGRVDEMLVVGGNNVYPSQVEALLERHDAVEDVVVVGAPHSVKGEAPVAFVVAGDSATEDALKEFTLDRGPAYAHPRRVFFRDELPLTGTGKVDRRSLEAEARELIDGEL